MLQVRPTPVRQAAQLDVLEGFELRVDRNLAGLPISAQRLLAYLAAQDRAVSRSVIAGTLRPDKDELRAAANLRSTLWRLRQHGDELVTISAERLELAADVVVERQAAEFTGPPNI